MINYRLSGLELPATTVYDYPTVKGMVELITSRLPEPTAPVPAATETPQNGQTAAFEAPKPDGRVT